MDKKGIVTYLGITLVLSYAVQAVAMAVPHARTANILLLGVPACAAWLALRRVPNAQYDCGILWPVPYIRALRIAGAIYLAFALVFLITSIVGFTKPDWTISELLAGISSYKEINVPPQVRSMLPRIFLLLAVVLMFIIAPTIFAAAMLGPVYGWYGYLLPRLMPLGRWKAYALVGCGWAISLMPSILMLVPNLWLAHASQMLALAIAISAMIGEVWRRSGHLGLTAVAAGCVYCHTTQLWPSLFPTSSTVFPWGGTTGLFFTLAWLLIALVADEVFGPLERCRTAVEPQKDLVTEAESIPESAQ